MMMKKKKVTIIMFSILAVIVAALIFTSNGNFALKISESIEAVSWEEIEETQINNVRSEIIGKQLKGLTLIPPIIAVLLAFITKEVITSLIAGVLSGYTILYIAEGSLKGVFGGVLQIADNSVRGMIDVVANSYNASVIILCLVIGGLVGVIRISGSFNALASKLIKRIKSPKGATLTAEVMGSLIFFDDYANSLIVGPVMSPITDKLKVSREKLAYIVDSTAAPVAGIAIISSWISAELAAINSGFEIAGVSGSAYSMFLGSIPFCFYNIFCLAFIFLGSATKRDYGNMLKAEVRARKGAPVNEGTTSTSEQDKEAMIVLDNKKSSVWVAIAPIITLCLFALVGFYFNGMKNAIAAGVIQEGERFSLKTISIAFGNADTVTLILEGSLLASVVAIILGLVTKAFKFLEAIEAWLKGAGALFMTVVILALAWTLSGIIAKLGTAYYLTEIISLNVPYFLIPTLIFIACCSISFAAGSYGCMLIVMPITIPIAYSIAKLGVIPVNNTESFIFSCVAAVLSGSIFGDHCSPITDTTILSSVGAGCNNIDHVKTQLPYALTVAGVSACIGTLLSGFGVSFYITIPLGILVLTAILFFFGKDADKVAANSQTFSPFEKIVRRLKKNK